MTSFSKQYSFPNVSVKETIRGPQPFNSVWRNTIGIAAPFTKGPLLARINSRQEFVSLFGEDNSLGSVAVRQAMLQGATDFVISRVAPVAKKATTSISFTAPDGAINEEPMIGSTDNRTVGLTVEFSYISDALTENRNLVAYSIGSNTSNYIKPRTNKGTELDLDFEGIGSFIIEKHTTLSAVNYDFFLRTTEPLTTNTKTLAVAGFDEIVDSDIPSTTGVAAIRKITFPKASITKERYLQAFQPGMRITGGTEGPIFDTPGLILSELFEEDAVTYAFYAQITTSAAGTDGSFKLLLPTDDDQDVGVTNPLSIIDVYRVYWRSPLGYYLPGVLNFLGADPDLGSSPISYLVLNRNSDAGVSKNIVYYTKNPDSLILEQKLTGVTYTVGVATDSYINVIENIQTINIMKTIISLGESEPLINGYNSLDAFAVNTPVSLILSNLRTAIARNSILSQLGVDSEVNNTVLPYNIFLTLGAEGEYGNYLVYKVNKISSGLGDDDIEFLDGNTSLFDTPLTFINGSENIVPASRFFYSRQGQKVLYVEAISPGVAGNNIYINIRPVDQSNFILEVKEFLTNQGLVTSAPSESFYLSNTAVDFATGLYPETLSSNFIRAYYVPIIEAVGLRQTEVDFNQIPARVAPPDNQNNLIQFDVSYESHPNHAGSTYLQNVSLIGGVEPSLSDSSITEEAYIAAIDRLENEDIAFISAPGIIAGDIRYERAINALIQQVDQASPYNGLRIGVISTPPKLTKSRAEILNAQYSSRNLVLIGGWSTLITSRGVGLNQYSPEGYYLGLLATTDTYVSPASSYDGKYIIGATNVDTNNRLESLDTFTNNNIEMLYVDRVSNKIKFLNGRTTAGNINDRWISIRRQTQHLIMNIVQNLEWARSAPNNDDIRQRAASAVDAILKVEQRRGAIAGYNPTIINTSDPSRYANGFLDLIMVWTPVFPADYISVELIRSVTTNFTLQVSSN